MEIEQKRVVIFSKVETRLLTRLHEEYDHSHSGEHRGMNLVLIYDRSYECNFCQSEPLVKESLSSLKEASSHPDDYCYF